MKTRLGKITLVTVLLMAMMLFGMLAQSYHVLAEPVDSYNISWKLVRETAVEDGDTLADVYALDTNEGNWAIRDANTVANGGSFRLMSGPSSLNSQPESPGSKWAFVMCGGAENNDTFDFDIVGWVQGNGMAQVICTGNGIIGTQDVVYYPDDAAAATNIWWADTIVIDANTWPGIAVYNSTTNNVCMLEIKPIGLEYIQFVISKADETGTEANDITVYGRPY